MRAKNIVINDQKEASLSDRTFVFACVQMIGPALIKPPFYHSQVNAA